MVAHTGKAGSDRSMPSSGAFSANGSSILISSGCMINTKEQAALNLFLRSETGILDVSDVYTEKTLPLDISRSIGRYCGTPRPNTEVRQEGKGYRVESLITGDLVRWIQMV